MRFSVMLEVYFFAALQVLLFSMVQGTSCQPSCILVSNTTDILMVDPKTSRAESVVSNLHRAVALDVDVARGYIYWSDVIERAIRRARINGSDMEVLFALDVGISDGLALDWVSGLLYWSDTTYDVIEVASVYTPEKARRVLINDGLESPRGIAIAPNDRFMFWTDWGRVPKIERSFLNGDGRKTIVSNGLVWPNDVTVDLTTRKIFWVESYLDKIETADYDGNGRRALPVYAGRLHPFSLIFYERIIYWTDWVKTEGLYSLNTSNNQVSSINVQGSKIMGIAIFNQTSQPRGSNPCGRDNGGCSHLCLAKSVRVQCACPTGLALLNDTRTCKKDFQHFLLFADANSRTMNVISLDVNYFARSTVFRYLGVQKPTAIDYDPVEDRIYWTDPHQHWIARAFRNASRMEILYTVGIETPYGLAFDWIGRNIYWTDNGTDSIMVGKLDGSANNSLITEGLSNAMDIVVNPRDGEMYWTDWGGIPRIEKASTNGSLRRIIVISGLMFPNALDIDLSANKLYWTDIGRNYIEQSDLDGRNRRVLLHAANIRPFGMALYQGYLYWTDWSRRAVLRLNISSGENITVVVGLSQPMDIQAYYPGMRSASTALLCSPLTGLEYVQVTPDKCQSRSKPETVCVLSCPRGFTLRGTQTRTCGPRGIWSGKNDTRCQVVTCPSLIKPENGEITGCLGNQAPQFTTSCKITCNQGYQLSGSSVRRCLENGEWSGTDTRCTVTISKTFDVNSGDSQLLPCTSFYNSPDTFKWKRGGEFLSPDTSRINQLSNGSLLVRNVSTIDSGYYLCVAPDNTILYNVTINVKVQIAVEMALRILNVEYTDDFKNKTSKKYQDFEKNFTETMDILYNNTEGYEGVIILAIRNGSAKVDFKVIIVRVVKKPGRKEPEIKVEVAGKIITTIKKSKGFIKSLQVDVDPKELQLKVEPPAPQSPRLEEIKETSVIIVWKEPEFHEFYNIKGYVVGFRKFGSGNLWINETITGQGSRKYILSKLQPETRYYVNVAAKNSFGIGVATESQQLITKPAGLAEWIIVVVIVAAVLLLVLIVVLVLWHRKKCSTKRETKRENFYDMELRDAKPNEYDVEHVTTLSWKTDFRNDVFEGEWREIPRENLKMSKMLGSGAFGAVYKGLVVMDTKHAVECAVKTVKENATEEEKRELWKELEIMSTVGSHENLVNLIGACTKGDVIYIAIEFAENGCLLDFLKNNRSEKERNSNLDIQTKMLLALDVAKGMAYLASKRCIHRDLAARNVLLTKEYRGKIADFGMSRDIYSEGVYEKKTAGKLPFRWMALEAIETFMFTAETDVWSYGVLLWEIETGGLVPWGGLNAKEIIKALKSGNRLEKPAGCMEEVYEIMISCWSLNPKERPSFRNLADRFENILTDEQLIKDQRRRSEKQGSNLYC